MKFVQNTALPELEVKGQSCSHAHCWSFRFTWGWAIFTINDVTGEFFISSDWGNYSHRWNPDPNILGEPSLTYFLAKSLVADPCYVIGKFKYSSEDLRDRIDETATRKEFKKLLKSSFQMGEVIIGDYQDLVAEIGYLDYLTEETLLYSLSDSLSFTELFDSFELIEGYVKYCRSPSWIILEHALLPFFGKFLEKELLND